MDELDRDTLTEALSALGQVLQVRGLSYQVVVVGGANLTLRGIVSRPTKDADLLGTRSPTGPIVRLDELPAPLAEAIGDVALTYALSKEWLNLGPRSLLGLPLPDGFEDRLEAADFGALRVWFAGTFDLVCFKLWAAADHWPSIDRHFNDLLAIGPARDELLDAARWTRSRDPSPSYRSLLVAVLLRLGVEDAEEALDA